MGALKDLDPFVTRHSLLLRAFIVASVVELPLAIWFTSYVNRGGEVDAPSILSYYHAVPVIVLYVMSMIFNSPHAALFFGAHWTAIYFLTVFLVQSVLTTPVLFLVFRIGARKKPQTK